VLHVKSQASTTKFVRVQRAEKSYKQVALCIFLRMRNTSNQLFPKRSDEREFPYHRGNESEGKDGEGGYKCAESSLVASSVWRCGSRCDVLTTSLSSFYCHISHFVTSISAPKSSATCTRARKTPAAKSDEASSRVTNHLSRGARFCPAPKRERWNCNDSKNASRCGDRGIMLPWLNLCQLLIQCFLTLFSRTFSLATNMHKDVSREKKM